MGGESYFLLRRWYFSSVNRGSLFIIEKYGVRHGGLVFLRIIVFLFHSHQISARVGGSFIVAGQDRKLHNLFSIFISCAHLLELINPNHFSMLGRGLRRFLLLVFLAYFLGDFESFGAGLFLDRSLFLTFFLGDFGSFGAGLFLDRSLFLALFARLGFSFAIGSGLGFRRPLLGLLGGGRFPGFRLGQRSLTLLDGEHCRRLNLALSPGPLQAKKQ